MAAPTPVSALVHSSTLVTAGVYILIRYSNVTPSLLYLGSFTFFLAGLSACVESDIKKVVALSTLSQLRVMFVSLGSYAKSFCFYHIIAHAYFKALLFICVGVGIHSTYATQDSRRIKCVGVLPTIFTIVSIMSLMGFVFTAGFHSKHLILEALYRGRSCFILAFLLGAGLTAFYSRKLLKVSRGIRNIRIGGLSWSVKFPLSLLGFASVMRPRRLRFNVT